MQVSLVRATNLGIWKVNSPKFLHFLSHLLFGLCATHSAFVLKSSSSKASNSAVSQYECYFLNGIAIQFCKEHLQNISQKYV